MPAAGPRQSLSFRAVLVFSAAGPAALFLSLAGESGRSRDPARHELYGQRQQDAGDDANQPRSDTCRSLCSPCDMTCRGPHLGYPPRMRIIVQVKWPAANEKLIKGG